MLSKYCLYYIFRFLQLHDITNLCYTNRELRNNGFTFISNNVNDLLVTKHFYSEQENFFYCRYHLNGKALLWLIPFLIYHDFNDLLFSLRRDNELSCSIILNIFNHEDRKFNSLIEKYQLQVNRLLK